MRIIGAASLIALGLSLGPAKAFDWYTVPPIKGNDTGGIIAYSLAQHTDARQLAVDHCASYGKVVKFLAVQPTDSWRELWVFRKNRKGWSVRVVAPAPATPGVGTAEFAGWERGNVRVSREAIVDGRVRKSVQLVRL